MSFFSSGIYCCHLNAISDRGKASELPEWKKTDQILVSNFFSGSQNSWVFSHSFAPSSARPAFHPSIHNSAGIE